MSLQNVYFLYFNVFNLLFWFLEPFESQPLPAPAAASTGTFRKMEQRHIDELKNEVWFHGQISRAEAEKRLVKDGDFLVRESPNTEGQYVLSGMQDRTRKHLLLIDPEGVVSYFVYVFKPLLILFFIYLGKDERQNVSVCYTSYKLSLHEFPADYISGKRIGSEDTRAALLNAFILQLPFKLR